MPFQRAIAKILKIFSPAPKQPAISFEAKVFLQKTLALKGTGIS
jgi:hypothetical protein